ncbi:peptidylprolyl isomerase [Nostoc sp. FACHB-110]|uniref:peptidylprolyl isomerase n=1 Tax=Nostoc sp. FACHB-110 TaxID=2692834 RepID=UPI001687A9FE|nr:peptidylprolyl isomerase [Nostoc sp. FACHB-110]MBD2435381.1 peptidylprolyl isomerase [Nostoc sp. FACHB-110]
MSKTITITAEDIIHQIQISCKLPEVIEQIVNRKIITDVFEEAGITVDTEELQKAADQIRLGNKLHSAEDTWKWLEKYFLTLESFEEIVFNSLKSGKVATHLFADKIEPYFYENQLDYTGAVIYEIILDDEDLALELFYAIQEGEISFYDVAHKYIQDIESRRICGYKGTVNRKELQPEISAAVFAANPPQLLKPIVSSKGIHLIFVEEIIQPVLDQKLRYKIAGHLFSEWLKQQSLQLEIINEMGLSNNH